jgi:hypothetical protein
MEPYITYRDFNNKGELEYYILQRKFPHYQGVILEQPKDGAIMTAPVSCHHLYITFAGTIQGNYVLSKAALELELSSVFEDMANWFYSKRVVTDPKRYKKFKI